MLFQLARAGGVDVGACACPPALSVYAAVGPLHHLLPTEAKCKGFAVEASTAVTMLGSYQIYVTTYNNIAIAGAFSQYL